MKTYKDIITEGIAGQTLNEVARLGLAGHPTKMFREWVKKNRGRVGKYVLNRDGSSWTESDKEILIDNNGSTAQASGALLILKLTNDSGSEIQEVQIDKKTIAILQKL